MKYSTAELQVNSFINSPLKNLQQKFTIFLRQWNLLFRLSTIGLLSSSLLVIRFCSLTPPPPAYFRCLLNWKLSNLHWQIVLVLLTMSKGYLELLSFCCTQVCTAESRDWTHNYFTTKLMDELFSLWNLFFLFLLLLIYFGWFILQPSSTRSFLFFS